MSGTPFGAMLICTEIFLLKKKKNAYLVQVEDRKNYCKNDRKMNSCGSSLKIGIYITNSFN